MKKLILSTISILSILILSCEPETCTKTIQTFDGPQEIEVDCAFAD